MVIYLINARPLAPPLGELDAKRTEGVSYRPKELGWAVIVTSYHSTRDTPPDLAFLATLPRGEDKGCGANQINTSFAELTR